jgi:hypothetical protein
MRLAAIVVLAACSASPHPALSGSGSAPLAPVPAELACKLDDDCIWGELAIEVTKPEDCDCRRCNSAIVNLETSKRRSAAWLQHCKQEDHILNGRKLCPIDHCLEPALACHVGRCVELPMR